MEERDNPWDIAERLRSVITLDDEHSHGIRAVHEVNEYTKYCKCYISLQENTITKLLIMAADNKAVMKRETPSYIDDVLDWVIDNIMTLDGDTLTHVIKIAESWTRGGDKKRTLLMDDIKAFTREFSGAETFAFMRELRDIVFQGK